MVEETTWLVGNSVVSEIGSDNVVGGKDVDADSLVD